LIKGNGFEFSVGVEAVDHGEDIVDKADDRVDVDELIHGGEGIGVSAILDGGEEVDHEGNCEEDGDEDEEHHGLVAALVLDHVEDEDEKEAEDCLLQKFVCCDEVQKDYYALCYY
jgi:hypothetical protein